MKLTRALLALASPALLFAAEKKEEYPVGYDDTPLIVPGGKWKVHDINRPRPGPVQPSRTAADAPADAVVLFNGEDVDALCIGS